MEFPLVFLVLILLHSVYAFNPSPTAVRVDLNGRVHNRGLNLYRKNHVCPLYSTTSSSSDAGSRIGQINDATSSDAQKALQRLIERQKAEVEYNERLLEIMKEGPSEVKDFYKGSNDEMSYLAASIMSGFDYGFVSRSEGSTRQLMSSNDMSFGSAASNPYKGPPANMISVGVDQFRRNWNAIKGEYRDEADKPELTERQIELRAKLEDLTLNATEIWEREYEHHGGKIEAPLLIKLPYLSVCYLLDVIFDNRNVFCRFYLLETVARMPYFSYITMLHLYETLGFWRRSADMKRIHFAEELNEYQHLLIMESLGGDQPWWVRFIAQHSSIVYYVALLILWAVSPSLSYKFSELLETHAVNTYGTLIDENEKLLKELPPSTAAINYYSTSQNDPFYAEFQTSALSTGQELRRPGQHMVSLYDVFCAIRDDEADHVGTMEACLDPEANLRSASLERRVVTGFALASIAAIVAMNSGEVTGTEELSTLASNVVESLSENLGLDALLAGIGGVAQQVFQDDAEGNLLEMGSDLSESVDAASGGGIRRGLTGVFEALGAIFSRFL